MLSLDTQILKACSTGPQTFIALRNHPNLRKASLIQIRRSLTSQIALGLIKSYRGSDGQYRYRYVDPDYEAAMLHLLGLGTDPLEP